jgi:hypothetical protein
LSHTNHFQAQQAGKLMHPREMKQNDWHKVTGMYITKNILFCWLFLILTTFRMISEKFDGVRAYLQFCVIEK